MTVATATDVANRIGRPLTPKETVQVTALLQDTEAEIIRLGAGAKVADPNWAPLVRKVECAVVRRAARIPDALQSSVPGDEATGFPSQTTAQGAIYLRREERRSLGLPLTGAARITPDPVGLTAVPAGWDWGPGWGDCDFWDGDYWYEGWPY